MSHYFANIPKEKLKEISAKGNAVIQLQIAKRNKKIKEEYSQGYTPTILASRHKLSSSQIYRIIKLNETREEN